MKRKTKRKITGLLTAIAAVCLVLRVILDAEWLLLAVFVPAVAAAFLRNN